MQWWDAVDVIGVDAYYPLTPTNTNPCACSLSMPLRAYLSYNPSQVAPLKHAHPNNRLRAWFCDDDAIAQLCRTSSLPGAPLLPRWPP